jgi:hypothetical protein
MNRRIILLVETISLFAIIVWGVNYSSAQPTMFFVNATPSSNILGSSSYYTFEFNKNPNIPTGALKTIRIEFSSTIPTGDLFKLENAKLIQVNGIGPGVLKQVKPGSIDYVITDPRAGPFLPTATITIGGITNPSSAKDNTITLTGLSGDGSIIDQTRRTNVSLVSISDLLPTNSIESKHIAQDAITAREMAGFSKFFLYHCDTTYLYDVGPGIAKKYGINDWKTSFSVGAGICPHPDVKKGDLVFTDGYGSSWGFAIDGYIGVMRKNLSELPITKGTPLSQWVIVVQK